MSFSKRFRKPKATVTSTIPRSSLELGEDLKGAITISSQEEFDATEVRAELRCVEKKGRERWRYDEERDREVRRVYWDGLDSNVTWTVKEVVAIKGCPDVTSGTTEFQVIRPAVPPTAAREKK